MRWPSWSDGAGALELPAQIDEIKITYWEAPTTVARMHSPAGRTGHASRMLFGSETPGAGTSTVNPDTGRPSDDLVPVIDALEFLTGEDKKLIFHENAVKVLPLLRTSVGGRAVHGRA